MEKGISLIGCFRSGTNFTRTVLESNFNCIVSYNTWGWKHGLMPTYNKSSRIQYGDTSMVTVVKNPFSILDSWFKYISQRDKNLKGNKESLASFLRSPVYFYDEVENNIAPEYYFANPVQMWNSVVWNHTSFVEQMKGVCLTYESLLSTPDVILSDIASKFNLDKTSDELIIPELRVQNMGDGKSLQNRNYLTKKKFDKSDYFLDKVFLSKFSDDDITFVKKELNPKLLTLLGYDEVLTY